MWEFGWTDIIDIKEQVNTGLSNLFHFKTQDVAPIYTTHQTPCLRCPSLKNVSVLDGLISSSLYRPKLNSKFSVPAPVTEKSLFSLRNINLPHSELFFFLSVPDATEQLSRAEQNTQCCS